MASPEQVAQWMWDELQKQGYLTEEWVIHEIQRRFGTGHTYYNNSGNLTIKESVRRKFRQLCLGKAQWYSRENTWRIL